MTAPEVARLLRETGGVDDVNEPTLRKYVREGMHEGYPLCCIAYFVGPWLKRCRVAEETGGEALREHHRLMRGRVGRFDRVPCDRCLTDAHRRNERRQKGRR